MSSNNETAKLSPAAHLAHLIMGQAIHSKASHIYVASHGGAVSIDYRIDDLLRNLLTLPLEVHQPLVEAICQKATAKPLRGPRLGHFWESQSGRRCRFDVEVHDGSLQLRLTPLVPAKPLVDLQFSESALESLRKLIEQNQGLIFLSGPARSGRSSLLAALLIERARQAKTVLIDPDWHLPLPNVKQIKSEQTLVDQLSSVQRQDFSVVGVAGAVGESEMKKLHELARRHLVIACVDEGVSAGASAIVRMQLLPALCSCKFSEAGETETSYVRNGCEECSFKGVTGRLPIVEIITKAGLLTNFGDEAVKLADAGRIERQVAQDVALHTEFPSRRAAATASPPLEALAQAS